MFVFITVIVSAILTIAGLVLLISAGKLPEDKKRGRKKAGVVLIVLAIVLFFFVNMILPAGIRWMAYYLNSIPKNL